MAEKKTRTIEIKMGKDNPSMNLAMTPECKEQWQKFMSDKNYSFLHVSAALSLYMELYNAQEIDVKAVL